MRKLECVFVANVILYLRSIETIVKLIQVNKKCQEAAKILRYYNTRKLYENDGNEKYDYVIVKSMFELFPNIETVRCRYQDVMNNLELFEKVKQIELDRYWSKANDLPKQIKNKVISLDISYSSLDYLFLNEFPNISKVKVDCLSEGKLRSLLGDTNFKLKQIIVETTNHEEMDILKEYKYIETKIIKIKDDAITKERYHYLQSFSKVLTQYPITGIDIKDTFCSFNGIFISNKHDINRLYELTLFYKCYVENGFDLTKCELLEEIITPYISMGGINIQIKGLNNLRRIECVDKVDCIPSSVTYLSFNQVFNYKELLEKDNDCFNNIKEVEVNVGEDFEDNKIFMNFKNCTKLVLDGGPQEIVFKFPKGLRELIIYNRVDYYQMNEINKLTKLKKLSICDYENIDDEQIQKIYNNLKELEWLKTNFIKTIKLPSSLTYLETYLEFDDDLGRYTNLKEIKIVFDKFELRNKIKLPNKLNKLHIVGSGVIVNSNEIEVKRIILEDTNSQQCEWKSKIFIEKKLQKISLFPMNFHYN